MLRSLPPSRARSVALAAALAATLAAEARADGPAAKVGQAAGTDAPASGSRRAPSTLSVPDFVLHAEGAAAHMVGDGKAGELGWGAALFVAPELRLARGLGAELDFAVVGLSSSGTRDPRFAATTGGTGAFALPGLRVRPVELFASSPARGVSARHVWLAGGAGVGRTGDLWRAALDLRAGFDLPVSRFAVGPFVGLLQVVQPDGDLRPEDARIVVFGFHGAIDPTPGAGAGWADPDRDRDGIANDDDGCPDAAEDQDGFEDADGCPDLDDDKDGVPDSIDKCPRVAEDKDGFEDADGCPELDNDKDGLVDTVDKCPNDPEDRDGFEDEDGCSDLDNDKDGVPDVADQCPLEPETQNGYADDDGCPDEPQVRVVGDRIELDDRVRFEINNAGIWRESWPLVGRLAGLLNAHPEYALILIQGHADDQGDEAYNLELSAARARSVAEMLVGFGVARKRLRAQAFGETHPRAPGKSALARKENRRVEIVILERKREVVWEEPAAEAGNKRGKGVAKGAAASRAQGDDDLLEAEALVEAVGKRHVVPKLEPADVERRGAGGKR